MPTGKGQTRATLLKQKRDEAEERIALRAKKSDKEQLKSLDSRNLIAIKERTRLEKRIIDEDIKETKKQKKG